MIEYRIEVHGFGGLYFATEWMNCNRVHATRIAGELAGVYGVEAVEFTKRKTTRTGIEFEQIAVEAQEIKG